jgi:hypothetical protein
LTAKKIGYNRLVLDEIKRPFVPELFRHYEEACKIQPKPVGRNGTGKISSELA